MSQNFLLGGPGLISNWNAGGCALATGVAGDPFGGANAARITEDGTTGTHSITQTFRAIPNRTLFMGAFVKIGSSGTRDLELLLADAGLASSASVTFDPSTGAVVRTGGSTGSASSGSSAAGNGWFWVWMTVALGNFSNLIAAPSLDTGAADNYVGDTTSNLLISGPIVALGDDLMGQVQL